MSILDSKKNVENTSELVETVLNVAKININASAGVSLEKRGRLNSYLTSSVGNVQVDAAVKGPTILGNLVDIITYFVSTWDTTRTSTGSSTSTQVKLPLVSTGNYNMTVFWGDGTSDVITTWNQAETTHTYATAGTYTIYIKGICRGWRFNNTGDRIKFMDVSNWGPLVLSTDAAFFGCTNMNFTATDAPKITTPSFVNMFRSSGNVPESGQGTLIGTTRYFSFNSNINHWDVTIVTNMQECFSSGFSRLGLFNQPLGNWNVSNVTNMSAMFRSQNFFNQNLNGWDTSNVTDMSSMINEAVNFRNGGESGVSATPVALTWNVGKVTTFNDFTYSISHQFNCDVSSWDVSSCTNFNRMFHGCNTFNSNLSNWDVSRATTFNAAFTNCSSFNNGGSPLTWKATRATVFQNIFENCSSLNVPIDIKFSKMNIGTGFNNNQIFAIKKQSDGKFIIGGSNFTTYSGVSTPRLVRINPDGLRDVSFNVGTGFNGSVETIDIQSDGKIIVGGNFTSYNGTSINRIIRLNTDATVDTSFSVGTGFNSTVFTINIQSDGKIIVGGNFTSYNGTSINRIIRLNSDGTIDTGFTVGTGFQDQVYYSALQSDGKIIVGGQFISYNGTSSNRIIRLNSDGTIDTGFSIGTGFNGNVWAIKISGTSIYIGGEFTQYNGVTNERLVMLNSDGTINTSFTCLGFNNIVYAIDIQSDDKVIVGGSFTSYNSVTHNRIIRLNTDGTIDNSFRSREGFNNEVRFILVEPNDEILVGGFFGLYDILGQARFIRLYSDGLSASTNGFVTLRRMFHGATTFNNGGTDDINNWDVSVVNNLDSTFGGDNAGTSCKFNRAIGNWNVGNVTTFSNTFRNNTIFNQQIGNWNTSKGILMNQMFNVSNSFNQNIGAWDVSNVTDFDSMFRDTGGSGFDNAGSDDIGNWVLNSNANVSLRRMFQGCRFNRDIGNWNTNRVTTMEGTFTFASQFNKDIGSWDVSNVTNFSNMFYGAAAFNQNVGSWDVSKGTNFFSMFYQAYDFNNGGSPDIDNWRFSTTATITNFGFFFHTASAFTQSIDNWNTERVQQMGYMFASPGIGSNSKESLRFWNISSLTNANFIVFNSSITNYDTLLINWASQAPLIQNSVTANFSTSTYSSAAAQYRALLTRSNTSVNISGAVDNGSGLIRITTSAVHNLTTDNLVTISGVTGTTEANGFWQVIVISTTQIDLVGSAFNNTYVSGGAVKTGYGWTITDGGQI
jgi:uncharacterized delta-60 repeat protein